MITNDYILQEDLDNIAKELKISRCTLDRLFREYKISQ